MGRPDFGEQFIKALTENNISLTIEDGRLTFVEVLPHPKPSVEEMEKFWYSHHLLIPEEEHQPEEKAA